MGGHVITTTLYRMFDDSGALLYVGISSRFGERLAQHRKDKNWWSFVADIKLEHHPTREAALAAECDAIRSESPIHNVVHNGGGSPAKVEVDEEAAWELLTTDGITEDMFRSVIVQLMEMEKGPKIAACEITRRAFLAMETPDHCTPCDKAAIKSTGSRQWEGYRWWKWPYAINRASGEARYRCNECGHHWRVWWSPEHWNGGGVSW